MVTTSMVRSAAAQIMAQLTYRKMLRLLEAIGNQFLQVVSAVWPKQVLSIMRKV